MFKGKKSIYILLPLNLLIWGYMAYKIYSVLNEEPENMVAESALPAPKLKTGDSSVYALKLNYQDPFLKQEPVWNRSGASKPAPLKPVVAALPKKAPVEKPVTEILYTGFIVNSSNRSTAAMVSVNGVSQIVKPGQVLDGVLFESVTSEAIVVKIGKEKRTIRR